MLYDTRPRSDSERQTLNYIVVKSIASVGRFGRFKAATLDLM